MTKFRNMTFRNRKGVKIYCSCHIYEQTDKPKQLGNYTSSEKETRLNMKITREIQIIHFLHFEVHI
jgi:hypothetical protein